MNNSRKEHLDALRGIAALIVVVVHYFGAFYPYTVFGNQGSYQQHGAWESILLYPPFSFLLAGHFAVALFFILSGYVLSYKFFGQSPDRAKLIAAIVKRPIRLGGIVLFTVIIGAFLWYYGLYYNYSVSEITNSKPWFAQFWEGNLNVKELLINIITSLFKYAPMYNPPLWSIKVELYGSMLVFGLLLLFVTFSYRLVMLLILVVLFELMNLSMYSTFLVGMVLAHLNNNYHLNYNSNYVRRISILFFVLSIYLCSYPFYVDAKTMPALYGFLPKYHGFDYSMSGALLLLISVEMNIKLKAHLCLNIYQFLGKISYCLYAIHFLILGSLSSWLFLYLNNIIGHGLSFLVIFILSFPINIILAYWGTKYVDGSSIKLASNIGKYTTLLVNTLITYPFVNNAINRISNIQVIKQK